MPLKQLYIIEKIKFLVASKFQSKKQIVVEVEIDAQNHRLLNDSQEREDSARVDHAKEELAEETKIVNYDYSRLLTVLGISVLFNIILSAAFILTWFFVINK